MYHKIRIENEQNLIPQLQPEYLNITIALH